MKLRIFLWTSMLGLALTQSPLLAQSEGGGSGVSGGGSGVSGSASSPSGGGGNQSTGGKDVKGEGGSPVTPVPPQTNTPEFHPPLTSPGN